MFSLLKKSISFSLIAVLLITIGGCSKGGGINFFSIEDDKALGQQVDGEIRADPSQFPILSRTAYADAYNYLDNMRDEILAGGNVKYKDDFAWELSIIHNDSVLNAFATPGGYIYVYTGLIHYLESASSLAGVMGHEIAHADERHSTEQMTKIYGIQVMLQVALGNNQSLLTDIASQLVFLSFSRSAESQADDNSVLYLCPTKYRADGAADFFQKIIDQGSPTPPQFLSTHPNPDNRVENIQMEALTASCSATISTTEEDAGYAAFQNMLP